MSKKWEHAFGACRTSRDADLCADCEKLADKKTADIPANVREVFTKHREKFGFPRNTAEIWDALATPDIPASICEAVETILPCNCGGITRLMKEHGFGCKAKLAEPILSALAKPLADMIAAAEEAGHEEGHNCAIKGRGFMPGSCEQMTEALARHDAELRERVLEEVKRLSDSSSTALHNSETPSTES